MLTNRTAYVLCSPGVCAKSQVKYRRESVSFTFTACRYRWDKHCLIWKHEARDTMIYFILRRAFGLYMEVTYNRPLSPTPPPPPYPLVDTRRANVSATSLQVTPPSYVTGERGAVIARCTNMQHANACNWWRSAVLCGNMNLWKQKSLWRETSSISWSIIPRHLWRKKRVVWSL